MARKKKASNAQKALAFAREKAKTAGGWIEFHNALFGIGGYLGELFPKEAARTAFVKTPEHAEIMQMLEELQDGDSTFGADLASAKGTVLVRMPRSLHAALLSEAKAEGVSLNQLCVAKLSAQLRAMS